MVRCRRAWLRRRQRLEVCTAVRGVESNSARMRSRRELGGGMSGWDEWSVTVAASSCTVGARLTGALRAFCAKPGCPLGSSSLTVAGST